MPNRRRQVHANIRAHQLGLLSLFWDLHPVSSAPTKYLKQEIIWASPSMKIGNVYMVQIIKSFISFCTFDWRVSWIQKDNRATKIGIVSIGHGLFTLTRNSIRYNVHEFLKVHVLHSNLFWHLNKDKVRPLQQIKEQDREVLPWGLFWRTILSVYWTKEPVMTKTGDGGCRDMASATVKIILSVTFSNCGSNNCALTISWPISIPFTTYKSDPIPCNTTEKG